MKISTDPDSGYYVLIIRAAQSREIAIGSRKPERFSSGWHVYTGSAAKGLSKRVERHFRAEKKFHWHIDYLLEREELRKAYVIKDNDGSLRRAAFPSPAPGGEPATFECHLAARIAALPGGSRASNRFGAGDCHCPGHLAHFPANPEKTIFNVIIEVMKEAGLQDATGIVSLKRSL